MSLTREQIDGIIERVLQDVAEIPDRNSPEGQPDMMLVTHEELANILDARLAGLLDEEDRAQSVLHQKECWTG